MRFVGQAINSLSNEHIETIERDGSLMIEVNGKMVSLLLEEVEIATQDIEGWLVANQGNLTVALDVSITEELKNEGIARELVNRIQNLRKESGLEVTDKIILYVKKDGYIDEAVALNAEYIKNETLTKELILKEEVENGIEIVFDHINTVMFLEKVK
jgi:isoleucyl-tRNA synthetase